MGGQALTTHVAFCGGTVRSRLSRRSPRSCSTTERPTPTTVTSPPIIRFGMTWPATASFSQRHRTAFPATRLAKALVTYVPFYASVTVTTFSQAVTSSHSRKAGAVTTASPEKRSEATDIIGGTCSRLAKACSGCAHGRCPYGRPNKT